MKKPKKRKYYEHEEQKRFVSWLVKMCIFHFAIPNGGHLSKRGFQANRLKLEGMLPGVPDIFIPVPTVSKSRPYHGLFIEMKREGGAKISDEQKKIMEKLSSNGYACAVCYGSDAAIQATMQYLNMEVKEKCATEK